MRSHRFARALFAVFVLLGGAGRAAGERFEQPERLVIEPPSGWTRAELPPAAVERFESQKLDRPMAVFDEPSGCGRLTLMTLDLGATTAEAALEELTPVVAEMGATDQRGRVVRHQEQAMARVDFATGSEPFSVEQTIVVMPHPRQVKVAWYAVPTACGDQVTDAIDASIATLRDIDPRPALVPLDSTLPRKSFWQSAKTVALLAALVLAILLLRDFRRRRRRQG